jgi:hypothetical protein
MLLALSGILLGSGLLEAQERVLLQPVDPGLPTTPVPVVPVQAPAAPSFPQPVTYPPPVYSPYPPPPPPVDEQIPLEVLCDRASNPAFWVGVDALIWWIKNQPLPIPVITTGPASHGDNAGALGQIGTVSLTTQPSFDDVGGVRLFAGGWFDPAHTIGLEGSVFWLDEQHAGFGVFDHSGKGQLVINEPVAGAPFITQVSAPGTGTGGATVNASSRLDGADLNLLWNVWRYDRSSVNLVGGFRYYELEESLDIGGSSTVFSKVRFTDDLGNTLVTAPRGSNITTLDFFRANNE